MKCVVLPLPAALLLLVLATPAVAATSQLDVRFIAEADLQLAMGCYGNIIVQTPIFEYYHHASSGHVRFYERCMRGEKLKAAWVNATAFEKLPPPQNQTSVTP
jgi:hypothetical protein